MPAREVMIRRSWRRVQLASPNAPSDLRDALWENASALLAKGTEVKPGDRTTIVSLQSANGRRYILKRSNLRGPVHTLLHVFLRSRGRWSWRNGIRLKAGGVPTAVPLALLEERWGAVRLRSYLLTEHTPGQSLLDWARACDPHDSQLARVADAFAMVWRRLGQLQLAHRDMKATNFIVNEAGDITLIDLDSMRRLPRGPLLARARRLDRLRFLKNWQGRPELEQVFRARIDTAELHAE